MEGPVITVVLRCAVFAIEMRSGPYDSSIEAQILWDVRSGAAVVLKA